MVRINRIEIIEVKQGNLDTIDSALEWMRAHHVALPHPLLVNPYRVVYDLVRRNRLNDHFQFGYQVSGGYVFTGKFDKGFVYSLGAERLDDSFVLYEPVLGYNNTVAFGTENLQNISIAKQRLKEKALEVAEECVLEELVDDKTFFISRGRDAERRMKVSEQFSGAYIFDATNLNKRERQKLSKHPFFKIFFANNGDCP